MTYASEHEKELLNRSHRRRMELLRASRPSAQGARTAEDSHDPRDPQRHLLRRKERLSLEATSPRLPALGNRLLVVQKIWRIDPTFERLNAALREVFKRARLGRDPLPSAGIADSHSTKTTGVGGENREDTTETRRFEAGKDTCWWIPRVCSSKPRCTARRCLTRTG
jgi:hypothetical protein